MKPAFIIEKAEKAGLALVVNPSTGKVKVRGERKMVEELIPLIRDNKAGLINLLLQTPVALDQARPSIVNGELRIPMNCEQKYKWWAVGQSVFDTLLELNAPDSTIENYIGRIESPDDWRRWLKIQQSRQGRDESNNKTT